MKHFTCSNCKDRAFKQLLSLTSWWHKTSQMFICAEYPRRQSMILIKTLHSSIAALQVRCIVWLAVPETTQMHQITWLAAPVKHKITHKRQNYLQCHISHCESPVSSVNLLFDHEQNVTECSWKQVLSVQSPCHTSNRRVLLISTHQTPSDFIACPLFTPWV